MDFSGNNPFTPLQLILFQLKSLHNCTVQRLLVSKQQTFPLGNVISAMFLVAGTCIGGGMLALPVATGVSGFFPSLVVMLICWAAMTITALLLLEASLWMEEGAHMVTITSRLLGRPGKIISWILFLFISYASIIAYTAGAGVQIATGIQHFFNYPATLDLGAFVFLAVFGLAILLGGYFVGRLNSILFIAMIAAYVCLVGMGIPEVNPEYLTQKKWAGSFLAVPLFLTAFSFQTMVPSLVPILRQNGKALRWAVVGGTIIAFIIYAIWQYLILGIVPVEGPYGLAEALAKGEPATQFLHEHEVSKWFVIVAQYFAFFAIVTSFLGIALGLYDFLSDGLHISKKGWGILILGTLMIVPTYYCAIHFERIFLLALEFSGGYGDSILNGIMPVLMVWIGRYKLGYFQGTRVPGGKILLFLVLCFFTFALALQILSHAGLLKSYQYELVEMNRGISNESIISP